MAVIFQNVRDTAANWASNNPTLPQGVLAYETDTGKWKLGTGATAWNSLGYFLIPSDALNAFPSQSNNSGKYLTTDGSDLSWATITSGASVEDCIVYAIALGG